MFEFIVMNILWLSPLTDGYDIALRMKYEGNKVKVWTRDKKNYEIYEGMLDRVDNFYNWIKWADFIVVDGVKMGKVVEYLRRKGKVVYGNSSFTDRLELERQFEAKIYDELGINTPNTYFFNNTDEAIKFVKKYPGRYVIKPNDTEVFLTYVGENNEGIDVIDRLEHSKEKYKKGLIIQDYIDGIEVAIGGFFNGNEFVFPININFEHKKLLNKNLGPQTGETGTLLYFENDKIKLFRETLEKMEVILKKYNERVMIDLNCIVTPEKVYVLEFTGRMGYPIVFILAEGTEEKLSDLYYGVANGSLNKFRATDNYCIGVVGYTPPFPFENEKLYKEYYYEMKIKGLNKENIRNIHLMEVKIKNGNFLTAGSSGYIFVGTAKGRTVEEAQKNIYKIMDEIYIEDLGYRTDIGERCKKEIPLLKEMGWLQ